MKKKLLTLTAAALLSCSGFAREPTQQDIWNVSREACDYQCKAYLQKLIRLQREANQMQRQEIDDAESAAIERQQEAVRYRRSRKAANLFVEDLAERPQAKPARKQQKKRGKTK
jgi:hypothetical protein